MPTSNTLLGLVANKLLGLDVPTSLQAQDIPPIISEEGEVHPNVKRFIASALSPSQDSDIQAPGLGLLEWSSFGGGVTGTRKLADLYRAYKGSLINPLLKKYSIDVKSPLFHNTSLERLAGIMKGGYLGKGGTDYRISLSRNPQLKDISGDVKDIQMIFDKESLRKLKDIHMTPYQFERRHKWGKEAEESITFGQEFGKKGHMTAKIPVSEVKAIHIRDLYKPRKILSKEKKDIKMMLAVSRAEQMASKVMEKKQAALESMLNTLMTKYRDIPVLLNPKKKSLFGKEYWDFLHQEQIARFVNLPQKSGWQTYKEALDEYRRFKINRP
jgi:hypothetical protein